MHLPEPMQKGYLQQSLCIDTIRCCIPTSSACSRPSSVTGTSPWWEETFPCRTQCTRKGICVLISPHSLFPGSSSALHRTNDLHIASTAAQVASQCNLDFFLCGRW